MIVNSDFAKSFAKDWIDSWNSHDLDRILSHYSADFEMYSPLIVERTGNLTGKLVGKHSISEYWKVGLAAQPPIVFALEEVYVGIGTVVIRYNSVGRRKASEVFIFDDHGLVVRAFANHAIDINDPR